MNSRARALVGAAIGAILVLVASPQTRPEMLSAFSPATTSGLTSLLRRPVLAVPREVDSGAAYLHAGAERLQADPTLGTDERRTLIAIATRGEAREPENSFWPLAAAVFRRASDPVAREAWRRACRCHRYYDHQRPALVADLDRVAQGGVVQAWMYAAVAPGRSAAMIEGIEVKALAMMKAMRTEEDRTEFAYETIRNGAMIRDGSERLSLGREGIAMIERATYPPGFTAPSKRSLTYRLWVAKATLTHNLREAGRTADAALCDRQFRLNDASVAFSDVADPDARFDAWAIAAVYVDTLPGAFLAMALAGGVVWLFGRRLATLARSDDRFRGPGLTLCSIILLVAGVAVGYPTIGLAAGACALVPALGPERPRRYGGEPLGPLHVLVVASLAFALGTSVVLSTVAASLPGHLLPGLGSFGPTLGEAGRWAAIGIVVLGASAFAAPAWALVRRYSTPALAAHTYRNLGRTMVLSGLVLSIAAAPLALALNYWVGDALAKIALNEQDAYSPAEARTGS